MPAVKQCAYLSSAPSQVSQGSLKFCQCWLWDDQSTVGPRPRFPKRYKRRVVLCNTKGWCSHFHVPYTAQRPWESCAPCQHHPQLHPDPHQLCVPQRKHEFHWITLDNPEEHLGNGDDTFKSLWLSLHWYTLLHTFFPCDNPASAMTSYQKRVQDTDYTLKNKVLSLLVTALKPFL